MMHGVNTERSEADSKSNGEMHFKVEKKCIHVHLTLSVISYLFGGRKSTRAWLIYSWMTFILCENNR